MVRFEDALASDEAFELQIDSMRRSKSTEYVSISVTTN